MLRFRNAGLPSGALIAMTLASAPGRAAQLRRPRPGSAAPPESPRRALRGSLVLATRPHHPDVLAYLEAENAYTKPADRAHPPAPEDAVRRDARPHPGDRRHRPVPDAATGSTTRTEDGRQYPIHCRKRRPTPPRESSSTATTGRGQALPRSATTPSARRPLAGLSTRRHGPQVHAARQGPRDRANLLPDTIPNVSPRSRGPPTTRPCSTVSPRDAKRSHKVCRHALGAAPTRWSTTRTTSASTSRRPHASAAAILLIEAEATTTSEVR